MPHAKSVARLELALVLGHFGLALYLVWFCLDLTAYDHAGHLASAVSFSRNGFHAYVWQHFSGLVQNLFYPPLQDFLLSKLLTAGGWLSIPPDSVYRFYVSLLVGVYLVSIRSMVRSFAAPVARLALWTLLSVLLWMDKQGMLYLQGFSFFDLIRIGLSTQFLGGTFLFFLIAELRGRRRELWMVGLLSLAILSHLVVGAASALFVLAIEGRRSTRATLRVLAKSACLTAFFWLPFLVYSNYMTVSTITTGEFDPYLFSATAFTVILVSFKKFRSRRAETLPLAGLALFFTFVSQLPDWAPPLSQTLGLDWSAPPFHYYRLAVLGWITVALLLASCIDRVARSRFSMGVWAVAAIALVLSAPVFPSRIFARIHSVASADLDLSPAGIDFLPLQRWHIVHSDRSVSFALDSLAAIANPSVGFTKGIFWESSRDNTILSSYLGTIDRKPLIIDGFVLPNSNCAEKTCLLNRAIDHYAVGAFLVADDRLEAWATTPVAGACEQRWIASASSDAHDFRERKKFRLGTKDYVAFQVSPSPRWAEPLSLTSDRIQIRTSTRSALIEWIGHEIDVCRGDSVGKNRIVWNADDETFLKQNAGRLRWHEDEKLEVESSADFRSGIRIRVDAPGDRAFRIKTSFFPGLQWEPNSSGARLIASFPGLIGVGHGELKLQYRSTALMQFADWLSLIAAIGWAAQSAWICVRRRDPLS